MSPAAIQVEAIRCGYAAGEVLSDFSLSVQPGELLVLGGPNGSGKTTLLRVLARLLKPRGGSVCYAGSDLWKYTAAAAARHIALAPQSERRDWPLSVVQAVRLGRSPHRGWFMPFTPEDEAAVSQALVKAGLDHVRDRPITELSGGEWRRMILARALAQSAQVLLLDEPTTGLDLKYQVEMLHLVRQLAHEERLAVVVSLHDLNQAALFADRLALICQRRLLAVGKPQEVLTPSNIETAYGVAVTVARHPVYGTPLIAPHMPG